jgi:hypothetical protein
MFWVGLMKARPFLLMIAAVIIVSAIPWGTASANTERILIPAVALRPIPGALGSQWITEISGRYLGSETLDLFMPVCPVIVPCVYDTVAPGEAFDGSRLPTWRSAHGTVLTLWDTQSSDTIISARVRDLSRGLLTWGTELPIVRERQVTGTQITLLNVPHSEHFRMTLRIYDFVRDDNVFIIRAFPLDGDTPLKEIRVPASFLLDDDGEHQGVYVAVVSDLQLPEGAPDRLRLTIDTEIASQFWAFISVINNDTQHMTVISPTRPHSD